MAKDAALIKRSDWAREADQWVGKFEGAGVGTGVTVLFFSSKTVGAGPVLHKYPYDEVFIIRQGNARFTVGNKVIEAQAGEIVLGTANIPHKFENLGPGRLETTDIHLSDRHIQTDLE
ncbi:MAG: cupin domain-containing protein [Paracoccaceae bacterium]|nr:cupin domain-containing protein [Paracoccaceae bacterium]MDG1371696.1 cupin domain-containing protein [Paracoccaceae bacterium]